MAISTSELSLFVKHRFGSKARLLHLQESSGIRVEGISNRPGMAIEYQGDFPPTFAEVVLPCAYCKGRKRDEKDGRCSTCGAPP
ncbi:MAG: hypothetical protein V4750_02675 [Pseudomonadota bacterium]